VYEATPGERFAIVSAAEDPRIATDGGHPPGQAPVAVHPANFRCGDWYCEECSSHYRSREPVAVLDGIFYCSKACLIEGEAFLRGGLHLCEGCEQIFEGLGDLTDHACPPKFGGMGGVTIA
jgi:hypothetical protein